MAKPFKTYEDLLIFLQDEKNLTIENMDTARHILLKTSYFSLISGYKDIFKNPTTGNYIDVQKLIGIFNYQLSHKSDHAYIGHYKTKHRTVVDHGSGINYRTAFPYV